MTIEEGTSECSAGSFARPNDDSRSGPVVFYCCSPDQDVHSHEIATKRAMAKALATLMGRDFAGDFDDARSYARAPYFVPSDTLTLMDQAQRLGIHMACRSMEDRI